GLISHLDAERQRMWHCTFCRCRMGRDRCVRPLALSHFGARLCAAPWSHRVSTGIQVRSRNGVSSNSGRQKSHTICRPGEDTCAFCNETEGHAMLPRLYLGGGARSLRGWARSEGSWENCVLFRRSRIVHPPHLFHPTV